MIETSKYLTFVFSLSLFIGLGPLPLPDAYAESSDAAHAPSSGLTIEQSVELLSNAEAVVRAVPTKAAARARIHAQPEDGALSREDSIISLFYARYAEEAWNDEQWQTNLRRFAFKSFLSLVSPRPMAPTPIVTPAGPVTSTDTNTGTAEPTTNVTADPEASRDFLAGLKVDAGYALNFGSRQRSKPYYRVEYNGKQLKEKGIAPTATNVGAPMAEVGEPNLGEDTRSFALRLEDGTVTPSGSLFDVVGVKNNIFGGQTGLLRRLRGVAQVTGVTSGEQVNLALGVETPPIHPLNLLGLNSNKAFTNYLIPGLVGEKQLVSRSDGENINSMVATYRSFIGIGRKWVVSEKYRDELATEVAEAGATKAKAKAIYENAHQVGLESRVEHVIRSFYEYNKDKNWTDEEWKHEIYQAGYSNASSPDQPSQAYWLESAGWYRANNGIGPRFGNMLAATATFWLNPSEGGTRWLRLRYEYGRERAIPTERKNTLLLSLGMAF